MKLYIGNLPFDTSEADLREAMAEFEPIEDVYMPLDRETGRPRGFAFVKLSNREIGERAIEAMDGSEIGGRSLKVSEAEDRRGGGGGGGGGGHRGGGGGGGYGGGGGGGGYGGGGSGPNRKYRKEKSGGHSGGSPGKRYKSI